MSYTDDQLDTYGQVLAVLAHHIRTRKIKCDADIATAVMSPAKGLALLHRVFVANRGLEGPGETMLVDLVAHLPELPAHLTTEAQSRVWLAQMRHLGRCAISRGLSALGTVGDGQAQVASPGVPS